MVKNVLQKPGCKAALVVFGWFLFIGGELLWLPFVSIPLRAIARVLP